MKEVELLNRVSDTFQKLGWCVTQEEKLEGYDFRFDLVLRYNNTIYGVVEIMLGADLKTKAKIINNIMNSYLIECKPKIFIITNGYKYDVYHLGEFYGSLTVPPTPENVELLLGGGLSV